MRKDLTKEELWNLRKEIVLNSLYYKDYKNSFNIDEHTCCDFFDGYYEFITILAAEKHCERVLNYELISDFDDPDILYTYYCEVISCM